MAEKAFLLVGDLHGRMPKIPKSLKFDAIIQSGDVCDDREYRKYIKKWFAAIKKGEKRSAGKYLEETVGKKAQKEMSKRSLEQGRRILTYLASFDKPVFFVPGNWDQSYGKTRVKDENKNKYNYLLSFYESWQVKQSNKKLVKGIKNIYDCQLQRHEWNGLNMIGYGLISAPENATKMPKKKQTSGEMTQKQLISLGKQKKKLYNMVADLFKTRNKKLPTIFIPHNIPYGVLDTVKDKKNYA